MPSQSHAQGRSIVCLPGAWQWQGPSLRRLALRRSWQLISSSTKFDRKELYKIITPASARLRPRSNSLEGSLLLHAACSPPRPRSLVGSRLSDFRHLSRPSEYYILTCSPKMNALCTSALETGEIVLSPISMLRQLATTKL